MKRQNVLNGSSPNKLKVKRHAEMLFRTTAISETELPAILVSDFQRLNTNTITKSLEFN